MQLHVDLLVDHSLRFSVEIGTATSHFDKVISIRLSGWKKMKLGFVSCFCLLACVKIQNSARIHTGSRETEMNFIRSFRNWSFSVKGWRWNVLNIVLGPLFYTVTAYFCSLAAADFPAVGRRKNGVAIRPNRPLQRILALCEIRLPTQQRKRRLFLCVI